MNLKRNEKVRRGGLTKKDHIKYWIDTARRDWIAVRKMLESRTYTHALFFMHLVLEKLLKAHWVKDNTGNHPPRTHDLIKLLEQTKLQVSKVQLDVFRETNDFQLEGRYPDYKQNLFRRYKKKGAFAIFASVENIRKCLLKELQ